MPSGEEIARATRAFAERWRGYDKSERAEAQTFLNELLACYGTDRHAAGVEFEDAHGSEGIMDMHWPGVCIVEMKAPRESEHLGRHRQQALDYWKHSASVATGRPAPPYVVLCAFSRFEVWEPGRFPLEPRTTFTLDELPDRYEALLFLSGGSATPIFSARRALTERASLAVARLYQQLLDRRAHDVETLRNFVLQVVWCLFAENVGLIDGRPVETIIDALRTDHTRSAAAELGHLFDALNSREHYGKHGVYASLPYANGGLFQEPARVDLTRDELDLLAGIAEFDWSDVDPTIFGSLMEACLGPEARADLGAHYTHEADILKIVTPTIIEPWRRRIDAATSPAEAEAVLTDLCAFRVLDPACGCGNFLYVAYRELRRLERAAYQRIDELARTTGIRATAERPRYPIGNIYGIDVNSFVVKIARVTLWMGHKLAADEFGSVEPPLPLTNLSSIRVADALAERWPAVDAIIGNPPFLGSQHIRAAHNDAYVRWLQDTFQCGVKDFCVYWFRKAQDHLPVGGRAGLVGTNSIAQNRARSASLDYVVAQGGVITDAVSTQKWPGEAKVHVSIVNWVKRPAEPPQRFLLDGVEVSGITAELRPPERSTGDVATLHANAHRCFQGPIPAGEGFVLSADEAAGLLGRPDAPYADVVRRYLIGDDIASRPDQSPSRWIIDFALRPLEEAMAYPAALAIVEERVKPIRARNNRPLYRQRWWLFAENRPGMRKALAPLARFIAVTAQGKRVLFAWQPVDVCPSNLTYVIAVEDDFSMGVLVSRAHGAWVSSRSSTIKGDPRYTPTTVFETFAWPEPDDDQRERVAAASREVIARRQEVCLREQIGLTTLYNRVDDGAYTAVKAAHRELDVAVAAAYGWPPGVAQDDDELVRRLLDLNRQIAAGQRLYDPFGTGDAHLRFGA